MGKAVGVSSPSQKQVEMKGVLGKHIGRYLDQYTFMCVFGSVLGYAVMPLIGTVETLVLSVIVIGLSIHGFHRSSPKEDDRRRHREERRSKKQDSKKTVPVQVITDSETQQRRHKEEHSKTPKDPKTSVEDDENERLRKLEEKREKKARKKEERNRRREEERKDKEREEMNRREKLEQRALKKQQEKEAREKAKGFLIPTYETIKAMVTPQKPVKRERKHSTSSTSSGSSYSYRSHPHTPPRLHPLPARASSDPILYPTQKLLPWGEKISSPATNTVLCPSSSNALWTPSHPRILTSGTPHTCTQQQSDLVKRPLSTAVVPNHTWTNINTSNSLFSNWMSPPRVETIVPSQDWISQSLLNETIWQDHPDNVQQNGGIESLNTQNSRFYSLFSKGTSTPKPLLDFQPSGGEPDHVIDIENRLDDTNLASTNTTEEDQSFDEWPNI